MIKYREHEKSFYFCIPFKEEDRNKLGSTKDSPETYYMTAVL